MILGLHRFVFWDFTDLMMISPILFWGGHSSLVIGHLHIHKFLTSTTFTTHYNLYNSLQLLQPLQLTTTSTTNLK